MNKEELKIYFILGMNYITSAIKILIVVLICFYIFNMWLDYQYKAQFLLTPCDLCSELNPHLRVCFKEASTIKKPIYPEMNNSIFLNFSSFPG